MDFWPEPNGRVHYMHDSSIFTVESAVFGDVYMSCVKKPLCSGVVCLRENILKVIKPHNHAEHADEVTKRRFLKILWVRTLEENARMNDIYKDLSQKYPEGAKQIYSLQNVMQGMVRARAHRPSPGYVTIHNEPSGKIHCSFDSHLYRITRKYVLFAYAKCVKAPKCPGRAAIKLGKFYVTHEHNHSGKEQRVERMRFLKKLKHRSALETESLAKIFVSEEEKQQFGSWGIRDFSAVKLMMSRARMIGPAPQPYEYFLPVDHSIYSKKQLTECDEKRTVIVGTPRINKRILDTGPHTTPPIDPTSLKHNPTYVTDGPIKIDLEKVPLSSIEKPLMKSDKSTMNYLHRKQMKNNYKQIKAAIKTKTTPAAQTNNDETSSVTSGQNLFFIVPSHFNTSKEPIEKPSTYIDIYTPPAPVIPTEDIKVENELPSEAIVENYMRVPEPVEESINDIEVKLEIKDEPVIPPKKARFLSRCDVVDMVDLTVESDNEDVPVEIENDYKQIFCCSPITNESLEISVQSDRPTEIISPVKVTSTPIRSECIRPLVDSRVDTNVSTQTQSRRFVEDVPPANPVVITETLMEMHKILKNLRSDRNSSNEVFGKYIASVLTGMTKRNVQAVRREILEVLDKYE